MKTKFRAWDKESKTMDRVRRITWTNGDIADVYLENIGLRRLDEIILMQSTGLKDKNSLEIFEGDVLTLKYPRDRRYTVTAKVIRGSQVSAMTLRFEDDFTTEEFPLYKISAEHNLEVLGNICENPELLEVAE